MGFPRVNARFTLVALLSVTSDERALAIARSCPHLTHGGRVELRRIWPS
jgi:hypothetical protein